MTLLERLKELREKGPELFQCGICDNIAMLYGEQDILAEIWERWEHYSGNPHFPVPDPQHDGSACAVHMAAGNHWDKSTKYGRLRWALLDYLIEELET